jgi:hypothetical protein
MSHSSDLIVRSATSSDREQIARLAALDSARPIEGGALVAEADARIVAALPLGAGRPVADPFEPTAEVVALLELRASQLSGGAASRRSLRDRLIALVRAPLPS